MKQVVFSLMFVFLVVQQNFCSVAVINSSGYYSIAASMAANPTSNDDSILRISASNVTVDLTKIVLSEVNGNAFAGLTGISIDSNVSNVTIRNGTIQNIIGNGISIGSGCSNIIVQNMVISVVTGTGIIVNQNCSNIYFDTIQCVSCATRGIELAGTAGNTINDGLIQNCEFLSCCRNSSVGDIPLLLTQCNRIIVNKCTINNSGNSSVGFSGVRLDTCANCDLQEIKIISNSGLGFTGFDIIASGRCTFAHCIVRNNTAAAGQPLRGFHLRINGAGTTNCNMLNNCSVVNNTMTSNGSANTVVGFFLGASSQNNILQQCTAMGNATLGTVGGEVNGFMCNGGAANNFQNNFIGCMAIANAAVGTANEANGFRINDSNYGIIQDCIGASNTSASSIARGLFFAATVGQNWQIVDSRFSRNIGSSAANSFGVVVTGGPTGNNLFNRVIGFNNNTTAANQLSGVPSVTTPTSPATNNLTAVTTSMGNVAVTI